MATISNESDVQSANQIEKYEYETLMIKLGRHATTQGADVKIDIGTGDATNVYNLKFTATGSYISILDFISAIENDSTLGFKIEEFKMLPKGTDGTLEATFTCRGIAIEKISSITKNDKEDKEQEDKDKENATNTSVTNAGKNIANELTDGIDTTKYRD